RIRVSLRPVRSGRGGRCEATRGAGRPERKRRRWEQPTQRATRRKEECARGRARARRVRGRSIDAGRSGRTRRRGEKQPQRATRRKESRARTGRVRGRGTDAGRTRDVGTASGSYTRARTRAEKAGRAEPCAQDCDEAERR